MISVKILNINSGRSATYGPFRTWALAYKEAERLASFCHPLFRIILYNKTCTRVEYVLPERLGIE